MQSIRVWTVWQQATNSPCHFCLLLSKKQEKVVTVVTREISEIIYLLVVKNNLSVRLPIVPVFSEGTKPVNETHGIYPYTKSRSGSCLKVLQGFKMLTGTDIFCVNSRHCTWPCSSRPSVPDPWHIGKDLDPYLWLTFRQGPSRLQQKKKKFVFTFYAYFIPFWRYHSTFYYSSTIKIIKKSQKVGGKIT